MKGREAAFLSPLLLNILPTCFGILWDFLMFPWWHLHKHIPPKRGKWGLMASNYLWFIMLFDRVCTGHIYSALIPIIQLRSTFKFCVCMLVCSRSFFFFFFFTANWILKPYAPFFDFWQVRWWLLIFRQILFSVQKTREDRWNRIGMSVAMATCGASFCTGIVKGWLFVDLNNPAISTSIINLVILSFPRIFTVKWLSTFLFSKILFWFRCFMKGWAGPVVLFACVHLCMSLFVW